MGTMSPPKARKAAMKPHEFRKILKERDLTQSKAAEILGVGRRTVIRWLTGETPIAASSAALIRETIG